MSRLQTNALRHLSAGSDNITLDNGGRVLMPNTPAFHAIYVGSAADTSITSPIKFNTVIENNGNCYNSATGLFTAPVAGRYFFSAQAHSNAVAGYIALRLITSGVQIANSWNSHPAASNVGDMAFVSGIKYMAAGDSARVDFSTDKASNYTLETYWCFSGYLIG